MLLVLNHVEVNCPSLQMCSWPASPNQACHPVGRFGSHATDLLLGVAMPGVQAHAVRNGAKGPSWRGRHWEDGAQSPVERSTETGTKDTARMDAKASR